MTRSQREDEDDALVEPIDLPRLLRNVLQDLQSTPSHYKRFGIFWWAMKLLLKREGYGPKHLYMLRDFQEPETAALIPSLDLDATIRATVAEYRFNAMYPHPGGQVETEEGDLVEIKDDDAGF